MTHTAVDVMQRGRCHAITCHEGCHEAGRQEGDARRTGSCGGIRSLTAPGCARPLASAGRDTGRAGVELDEVPGLTGAHRPATEHEHVREESAEREHPDADLHRPWPRSGRDEAFDES